MGYIKPMIIDSTFNPHLLGLLAHELGTDLTQGDPTDPADPAAAFHRFVLHLEPSYYWPMPLH